MRRPLSSVVSPTSSCSRGGTPPRPLRFHADDVAGHPPTIIINTLRLSFPAREVRGLSLPRDDRGIHGEAEHSMVSANFILQRADTRPYNLQVR